MISRPSRWAGAVALAAAVAWLVPSCSSNDGGGAAAGGGDGGGGADGAIGDDGGAPGDDGGAGGDGSHAPAACTKSLKLDSAFGAGGVATGSFGQVSSDREDTLGESQRVMAYPDGSLVFSALDPGMKPMKLTPAGQPDATFDATAAMATLGLDYPSVVGAGPNGAVYVGGYRSTGPGQGTGVVARLTSTGALDASFGTAGSVALDHLGPGGAAASSGVQYVVPLADGKVVAAGMTSYHVFIARLTSAGALDTSFGGGAGYVTFGTQYYDEALGLAVHDDGSFAVATYSSNALAGAPSIYFGSLFRRGADGAPLAGYGDAGVLSSNGLRYDDWGGVWAQPAGFDVVQSGELVRRVDPTGHYAYPFALHGVGMFFPVTLPGGDLVVATKAGADAIDFQRLTATADPCAPAVRVNLPAVLFDATILTADAAGHVYAGVGLGGDAGPEQGQRAIVKLDVDP